MNIKAVASKPADSSGENMRLSAAERRSKTRPWIFVGSGAKALITSPMKTSRRNFAGDEDAVKAFRRLVEASI